MAAPNADENRIDLDEYRRRSAKKGTKTLTLGGAEFTVPPLLLWPDEVAELAAAGKIVDAAKLVLGDDQWSEFSGLGGTATLLFQALEQHMGATMGKSAG